MIECELIPYSQLIEPVRYEIFRVTLLVLVSHCMLVPCCMLHVETETGAKCAKNANKASFMGSCYSLARPCFNSNSQLPALTALNSLHHTRTDLDFLWQLNTRCGRDWLEIHQSLQGPTPKAQAPAPDPEFAPRWDGTFRA
jgi:hypothetical protein